MARIVDDFYDPMFLETSPTDSGARSFSQNVRNNNNIVTTNAMLVHANPPDFARSFGGGTFFVGNIRDISTNYDIKFSLGDGSSTTTFTDLASCTVSIDSILWAKWQSGGNQSTGMYVLDPILHTFNVTDITNASLQNISLAPDEMRIVGMQFDWNPSGSQAANYIVKATQMPTDLADTATAGTANFCHFIVQVNDSISEGELGYNCFDDDEIAGGGGGARIYKAHSDGIVIMPNPANNDVTLSGTLPEDSKVWVSFRDGMGRTLTNLPAQFHKKGQYSEVLYTKDVPTGLYFIVVNINGHTSTHKVVIVH